MTAPNGRILPIQENEGRLHNDYSILDETDAFSVINVVPPNVRALIEHLPDEYFAKSEEELRLLCSPDTTLNCLRLAFWQEYSDSIIANRAFNIMRVASGLCTREYFSRVLLRPEALIWLITPPRNYTMLQEELMLEGLNRLRLFLSAPMTDKKTTTKVVEKDDGTVAETTVTEEKINVSAVGEARKVVEMLENRLRGGVVKRVAVQTQNVPSALPGMAQDPMNVLHKALALLEASESEEQKEQ